MNWRWRKETDPGVRYTQTLADVVGREAIRSAEQIVGAAWISDLLDAEQEALTAVQACVHMRDGMLGTIRDTQEAGDPRAIAAARKELTAMDEALATRRSHHSDVRQLVAQELEEWASATRIRVLDSLEDQGRLTKARRAAQAAAQADVTAGIPDGDEGRDSDDRDDDDYEESKVDSERNGE